MDGSLTRHRILREVWRHRYLTNELLTAHFQGMPGFSPQNIRATTGELVAEKLLTSHKIKGLAKNPPQVFSVTPRGRAIGMRADGVIIVWIDYMTATNASAETSANANTSVSTTGSTVSRTLRHLRCLTSWR